MRGRELPGPPAQLLGARTVRGRRVPLPRAVRRGGMRGARLPGRLQRTRRVRGRCVPVRARLGGVGLCARRVPRR